MDERDFAVFMFRGVVQDLRRIHGRTRITKEEVVYALRVCNRQLKAARQYERAMWTFNLCKLVEQSATLRNAYEQLEQLKFDAETTTTPDSNTGVTEPSYGRLEDYVAGE